MNTQILNDLNTLISTLSQSRDQANLVIMNRSWLTDAGFAEFKSVFDTTIQDAKVSLDAINKEVQVLP